MQNQQSGLELYAKDEESVLESEKNKYRFRDCSEKSIFKGNFEKFWKIMFGTIHTIIGQSNLKSTKTVVF